jgi:PEP-CTERM/exosortase A-associated glycosyltransferase
LSILKCQKKLGWETVHITSAKQGSSDTAEEEVEGFKFFRTALSSNWLSKVSIINQIQIVRSLYVNLLDKVATEKPDILHAHSPALNGLATALVSKKTGIPFIYEIRAFWEDAAVDHGTTKENSIRYRLTRALETYVVKQANAVTTICDGLRSDLIQRGIPEAKITIIPNAVNIDQFKLIENINSKIQTKFNLNDKFVIGFIGSFYAYEGLDLLLQAVKQLSAKRPNIRCLLVGGGLQENALKIQQKKLGLSDQVAFAGRVPHEQVSDYYSVIDLLIYPRISKRITELVTPLKPLEAMAQGRPFLASDVGGHKELITEGITGLLFKKDSVEDLVNSISMFMDNQIETDKLIRNGINYVTSERNWSNSVKRYENVYKRILGETDK